MDPQAVYVSYEGQTLHYIVEDPRYERKLKIVKKYINKCGFRKGYIQDLEDNEEKYVPDFID